VSASSRMRSLVIFVFLTLNLINTDNHQFCGSRKKKKATALRTTHSHVAAAGAARGRWRRGRLCSPPSAVASTTSPRAAPGAREELPRWPWRRPARSSPSRHGGGLGGARRPTMEATRAELADRPWRRRTKNSLSIGPLRASVAPNSFASLSSLGFLYDGLASAAPPPRAL
jgi:hypothetical protein